MCAATPYIPYHGEHLICGLCAIVPTQYFRDEFLFCCRSIVFSFWVFSFSSICASLFCYIACLNTVYCANRNSGRTRVRLVHSISILYLSKYSFFCAATDRRNENMREWAMEKDVTLLKTLHSKWIAEFPWPSWHFFCLIHLTMINRFTNGKIESTIWKRIRAKQEKTPTKHWKASRTDFCQNTPSHSISISAFSSSLRLDAEAKQ